jgi:hypothetical protein
VQAHLKEAKINRDRNAQVTHQSSADVSMGGALDMAALTSKLQATVDDVENKDASKWKATNNFVEKKAFRSKMKNHYKGEFNMAALMKAKPDWDADEDEEDQ